MVADHGEWPIERIAIGGGHGQPSIQKTETPSSSKVGNQSNDDQIQADGERQRRWWVGSVGHEDVLRMTDLEGFFRDNEGCETDKGALGVDVSGGEDSDIEDDAQDEKSQKPLNPATTEKAADGASGESDDGSGEEHGDSSDDSSGEEPQLTARKRKAEKGLPLTAVKKQKGKNTVAAESSFFDEL